MQVHKVSRRELLKAGGAAGGLLIFGIGPAACTKQSVDKDLAGPFAPNDSAAGFIHSTHAAFAKVLLIVFLIHIAGAMRQILFSEGETANRMLVATKGDTSDEG